MKLGFKRRGNKIPLFGQEKVVGAEEKKPF